MTCLALGACAGDAPPRVDAGADGVRAIRADVRGIT
jgi:hypothetical protein